jgi:hypothetical protein
VVIIDTFGYQPTSGCDAEEVDSILLVEIVSDRHQICQTVVQQHKQPRMPPPELRKPRTIR